MGFDLFALGLRIQTDGFDDAMSKLQQIDAIGKKIAGGGTFALIGTQASQSAAKIDSIVRSSNGVHGSFDRIAHKAVGVGSAIAVAGEVGTTAMEKIAHATANVAVGFGAEGAIVAAAAIAGLAIVSLFSRARKEMEETDQKARTLLKNLTLDTGATRMGELFSGDVAAKPGSPAALGLERARARAAELQRTTPDQRFGAASGLPIADQFGKQRDELRELNVWIKANTKAYDETRVAVDKLTQAETDRAKIVVAEGDKQRAAELEKLGLTRANGAATEALHAADAMIDVIAQIVNKRIETEIAPNIEKILQDSVQKGLTELPEGGAGIASAGLNVPTGLLAAFNERADMIAQSMRESIFNIFGDAIYEGFLEAFHGDGIGGIFKSLGKTILSAMGGLFRQLGGVWLAYGATMFKWSAALWNPATSGIAALAIGAALLALGGALGAVGNSGGGGFGGGAGGGSGYNSTQADTTRIRLMPGWAGDGASVNQRPSVNVFATIIGKNDPQAQRDITDLMRNAARRGL